MGIHSRQHGVEVVGRYLDEFPVLHLCKRLFRLTGEVTQYPHHKRNLFVFDGVANLHVVSDMNARRAHTAELLLSAFSCHGVFLLLGRMRPSGPQCTNCLLYTSPSPRDRTRSRMPSSA